MVAARLTYSEEATIDDWWQYKDQRGVELINGELVFAQAVSATHARAQVTIASILHAHFGKKRRKRPSTDSAEPDSQDPQWWIYGPTSLYFPESNSILEPDLCGWLVSRCPQAPTGCPVSIRPDWVCEVSITTKRKDTVAIPAILAKSGVPWYWIVDPLEHNIMVFSLGDDGKYRLEASVFGSDRDVIVPPFLSQPIPLDEMLGEEGDEDLPPPVINS